MKKIYLALPLLALAMTACDPSKFDLGSPDGNTSTSTIESAITINQVDADGNPAADGNYFTYTTSPALPVQIFNYNSDGKEVSLAHGAHGSFSIIPKRGQDSNQTFYIRLANHDGSMSEISKTYSVYVPTELPLEVKYLASDYGQKIWKWDTGAVTEGDWAGVVWGNMGYCGGAGADVQKGNGAWWGVKTSEEFNGQLQHTEDNTNHGDGDLAAYMIFNEDGTLKAYDADGNVIRSDTYSVEGWNPSGEWKVGDLVTKAILWPYEINSNGRIPGRYEICYLSADKMTLVYPDNGDYAGLGNWGEATYWHFYSDTDFPGMAAGYDDGKSWTWDTGAVTEGDWAGVVWGNMGYCGGAGADVQKGNGAWWGVKTSEEFNGQLQHTEDNANLGDGDLDAYMTFGTDGTLNAYDASGKLIRTAPYEFVPVEGNDWKVADLNTKAILWPYEINSNGNIPGTYEVVFMSGSQMTLVYPDGGAFDGLGNWGEATFWHFKKK